MSWLAAVKAPGGGKGYLRGIQAKPRRCSSVVRAAPGHAQGYYVSGRGRHRASMFYPAAGRHCVRHGNRLWPALRASGLTSRPRSTCIGFDFDFDATSRGNEKRVALTRSTHPFWMVLTLVVGSSDAFVLDQALAGALHLGLGGGAV